MNQTDNPFSVERVERLDFRLPAGMTWDALLERCAAANYCGAIVGPPGSGKSLLLQQLAPHLEARGFTPRLIRLNSETRRAEKESVIAEVRRMRAPDFLLLDGAEVLTTREWLVLRVAIDALAGSIITVHRTSRLPTLIETVTTPDLLEELATEVSGGRLPRGEAFAIHARCRGNLRQAFRELHDRWAGD